MVSWSRREVLIAAGLSALGCGDDAARFGAFEMSIQSWTFRRFGLDDVLAMVGALGLPRIELYDAHYPVAATPAEHASIQARLRSRAVACLTHGTNPLSGDHDANRRVFEFARAAGVRNLLADPPPEAFASLEALVAEYEVLIAIHNHGPGSRYATIDDVAAALAGRDPRIGTTVDTGHYLRAGVDPIAAIRAFAGRLYGVHLKDVAGARADAPDVILGASGLLDVEGVFRALRDVGFPRDASLSLEYEGNPDDPFEDVRVGLDVAARAARAASG